MAAAPLFLWKDRLPPSVWAFCSVKTGKGLANEIEKLTCYNGFSGNSRGAISCIFLTVYPSLFPFNLLLVLNRQTRCPKDNDNPWGLLYGRFLTFREFLVYFEFRLVFSVRHVFFSICCVAALSWQPIARGASAVIRRVTNVVIRVTLGSTCNETSWRKIIGAFSRAHGQKTCEIFQDYSNTPKATSWERAHLDRNFDQFVGCKQKNRP